MEFLSRPHGQLPFGRLELARRTGRLGDVADDGSFADSVAQDLVEDGVHVDDGRRGEAPPAGPAGVEE